MSLDNSDPQSSSPSGKQPDAATWLWRLDRGLSAEEQDQFFDWLAADPANADDLQRMRADWQRLDSLSHWRAEHSPPNPDLLAPAAPRQRFWPWRTLPLGLAAALAVGFIWWGIGPGSQTSDLTEVAAVEPRQTLPDASVAKLDEGTVIAINFTETERRVSLQSGRAFFIVESNPDRPFIVETNGIDVQAVGTAFEVRLREGRTEVFVAEGIVDVSQPDNDASAAATLRLKDACSWLPGSENIPVVMTLSDDEARSRLSWQHGMMTFEDVPLGDIVTELNWLNQTQVVLMDPALAESRFSGTIRSENVEGFVHLMVNAFGATAEHTSPHEYVLRSE